VDLDAFSAVHGATWARLDELAGRKRRLTGAESDELVRLYQEVATHLSTVRSVAPDPAVVSRLSDILGRARNAISGAHETGLGDVARFLFGSVPAALYRIRWWTLAIGVVFVAIAVISAVHLLSSPDALAAVGSPGERRAYAEEAFASYYSEHPHASFASLVWLNNFWISWLAIAFGITGIFPAWMLFQNAAAVGQAGAIMSEQGYLDIFFQLILPHGMLELTAIFVAIAAGFRLFWTVLDPGGRPRGRAVAEEGRAFFTTALGMMGALAVSGMIEGFVTPSSLPWPVKIAIGAVALAAFWAYVLVVGRRAYRAGETGDLAERDRGDVLPIAA